MSIFMGSLQDWELDKYKAVSPQLRSILRSRIIRNDLKPREKVSEPALAKLYNVSRQPVREAFITLVNEGLLEILPQRGTIVKAISSEAVLNGRFIREAVESDIVAKLAENPDKEFIAHLRELIDEQREAAIKTPDLFHSLDEKFHRTLAEKAGLTVAWDFLDSIKVHMDRVRFITDGKEGEVPVSQLIEHHASIVDGIESGNSGAAQNAMRIHLQTLLESLPKVKSLHPEYFTD
ncbi:GntR family transcriptional regulator [Vibrio sp. SCSIO 43132]|uniref:GntR family transcriptional regulator n=1 Tax=Vibrio sp. SCSIO 43132 TaxID=2779363 RepID=UPI001CA8478D|nr:GntR family transcriptional regulator [Vibrio sp. SCSIO 43132]UAB73234.1 GntR family transcriptional regulator [Vibrio sp. SCSIO 43132]